MKRCKDCGRLLPGDAFYAHPATSDRLSIRCRGCSKARAQQNRARNAAKIRDYERQRSQDEDRKEYIADRQRVRRLERRMAALKNNGVFSKLSIAKRKTAAAARREHCHGG